MEHTIYTMQGCPKCASLKMLLKKNNIEFTESDDFDILIENGYKNLPVLSVSGKLYEFSDAVRYIKTLEVK